jgi:MYXO-CTERM domain-containing protein/uncharacterized repeat protein (TIGR01451 family)
MRRSGLLLLVALLGSDVRAGAEIRVVNADGSNEGLNDSTPATAVGGNPGATVGEQRRIAFQYAASLWAATIGNQVPISIKAQFQPLDCSGSVAVLGTAGPTKLYDDEQYPAALANERAGRDLDPGTEEIDAQFSSKVGTDGCSAPPWYYGLDNQPPDGQTDVVTVLLHEFGHGLGFFSASRGFLTNAQDDTTQRLLSQLADVDYQAAIRRPMGVSWVGPLVRAEKDAILDQLDGIVELPGTGSWLVAKARFGGTPVDITAPLVRPLDAGGGAATDACAPIQPVPGKLVIADRSPRCLVARRAANAQAAGALGLIVRHDQGGDEPFSYGASDAGTAIVVPIWGISYDDGVQVENALASGEVVATVRAAARRAGENAKGDVLLYTPRTYSAGSSLAHWTRTAIPSLLMEPIINPGVQRSLDLTVAALADVGWRVPSGLSVGATKLLRSDLVAGQPALYVVQVVNRGSGAATGVVLDNVPDPAMSFQSNSLDCTTAFPCALGALAPGEVRTVIASYALPRPSASATQTFWISAGSPAPEPRYASATVVASVARSGCSATGSGPPGAIGGLLVLGALFLRRRRIGHRPRRVRARGPRSE